jgi:hypothetical protein
MEGLSLWPKIRKPLAAAVSTRGGGSELHAHCPGLRGLWPGARKSLHAGTQARRHGRGLLSVSSSGDDWGCVGRNFREQN